MSVFYYLGCDACKVHGPFLASTTGSGPDPQYRFIADHRDCAGHLRLVDEFDASTFAASPESLEELRELTPDEVRRLPTGTTDRLFRDADDA